jgi:4,5-DOPA dioxygenase extradiol
MKGMIDRKTFLKILTILPFASAMKLNELTKLTSGFEKTELMPALFIGHGSPMNAIENNEFTIEWEKEGKLVPVPKAILCISAHWETKGTFVTSMDMPKTIHDFGGFPRQLFDVNYTAPGSPGLAKETAEIIKKTNVEMDTDWGLDHGCWSVAKHLYPGADVPIIQMSLDYRQSPLWHYELARELSVLRQKGILILGSGNMVHNLRQLNWNASTGDDWAIEANEKIKELIRHNDHTSLANYKKLGKAIQLAVPSAEHFLPMLYVLGLKGEKDNVSFFNDKTLLGAITMTSLKISN